MRSSHGCIRLYPEDIEALFARVARGTHVRFVNQPVLAAWRDGELYLEVHPPLAEESRDLVVEAERALAAALERAGSRAPVELDAAIVSRSSRSSAASRSPCCAGAALPSSTSRRRGSSRTRFRSSRRRAPPKSTEPRRVERGRAEVTVVPIAELSLTRRSRARVRGGAARVRER